MRSGFSTPHFCYMFMMFWTNWIQLKTAKKQHKTKSVTVKTGKYKTVSYYKNKKLYDITSKRNITGNHNLENIMFALTVGEIYYLKLDKNVGPGQARQKGLEISNSEYILFIDSDDLFYDSDSIKNLYVKVYKFDQK